MSLASPTFPQAHDQQAYTHLLPSSKPDPIHLLDATPVFLDIAEKAESERRHKRQSKRHLKKDKKRKSKKKSHKKQGFGSYLVQLIGLICLVLAATKGFEPLTGVGFTLVIVGYKGGMGKDSSVDERLKSESKREKKPKRQKENDNLDDVGRLLEAATVGD